MEGLLRTTRGHLTVKSENHIVYIKPWGMGFEEVKAQEFLGVDLDGNLVDGTGRLHSELILHLEIYRRRKDVFSITHVHPFYSILLSSVFGGKMARISQHGVHFVKGIPFMNFRTHQFETTGRDLAQTLEDRPAVLMKNHGIVTVGGTIEEAVILTIDFEKAAKEHLLSSLFGRTAEISAEVAEKMNAKIHSMDQYRMLWSYYCRKLERLRPE
jgi:L-ribulose-5-phosphate 4-epimerase